MLLRNNNKLIFKDCRNNLLQNGRLIKSSLFDKFKRDHFRAPFSKASGVATKKRIAGWKSEPDNFLLPRKIVKSKLGYWSRWNPLFPICACHSHGAAWTCGRVRQRHYEILNGWNLHARQMSWILFCQVSRWDWPWGVLLLLLLV